MPYNLNMNETQIEAARLEFPKNAVRQYVYRLIGTVAGTTPTELFVDGRPGKRIGIPADSAVLVNYDSLAYEFTTATGAFSGYSGIANSIAAATNNGGTVALGQLATGVLAPSAQTNTTVAVTVDATTRALVFTVTGGFGSTTKQVEIIARVNVANRANLTRGAIQ